MATWPMFRGRSRGSLLPMSKLIADMSMSLDGKVATPDDDISPLTRWFFDVELEGPDVIEGDGVTHLRYRVGTRPDATEADAKVREVAQAGRS
jgi:hypothetical protein